jgi:hypothetical protein
MAVACQPIHRWYSVGGGLAVIDGVLPIASARASSDRAHQRRGAYASADPQAVWEAGGATALFALIAFGIVTIFVQIPNAALIFAGLTAFGFQRLARRSRGGGCRWGELREAACES